MHEYIISGHYLFANLMALKRVVWWCGFRESLFSLSIEEVESSVKYVVSGSPQRLYGSFFPNSLLNTPQQLAYNGTPV